MTDYRGFEIWVKEYTGKTIWEHQMLLTDEQYDNYLGELLSTYKNIKSN